MLFYWAYRYFLFNCSFPALDEGGGSGLNSGGCSIGFEGDCGD